MNTGPLIINTRDLPRRAGSMRELHMQALLAEPMGSDVIAIGVGAPVELDLRLEAVTEGVLVTGSASGTAVGECVRCLREVTESVEVDVTELFAYQGSRTERRDLDGDDELLPTMDGDLIDLEPTVTDAIVPALPFQPLCSPDCAGLCSECGVVLDEAEPDHGHESLDPRWAALAGLAAAPSADDEPDPT